MKEDTTAKSDILSQSNYIIRLSLIYKDWDMFGFNVSILPMILSVVRMWKGFLSFSPIPYSQTIYSTGIQELKGFSLFLIARLSLHQISGKFYNGWQKRGGQWIYEHNM